VSWELIERLKRRFPQVEPFPREGEAPAPGAAERPTIPEPAAPMAEAVPPDQPPGASPGRPAPTRLPPKPRGEEKAYVHMTAGAYVPRELLLDVCRFIATDPEFSLDYLSFVTGVDRPERNQIEVVYHLFSMEKRHDILLKVRVPRDDPRVPTVSAIWAGANWHEREYYDLLGIVFEGHSDLRRIMMTEDWVGFPLRKDYVYEDPVWLVEVARRRQEEIAGLGLGERA
jgi:NADH-quinone oxidoreductase subunit C